MIFPYSSNANQPYANQPYPTTGIDTSWEGYPTSAPTSAPTYLVGTPNYGGDYSPLPPSPLSPTYTAYKPPVANPTSLFAPTTDVRQDYSQIIAPITDASSRTYAPTDTNLYAPTDVTNTEVTDASKKQLVYNPINNTYVLVDARTFNKTVEAPPPTPAPIVVQPPTQPVQQQQQQITYPPPPAPPDEKKKSGGFGSILPWILGAGALGLGAFVLLNRKKDTPETPAPSPETPAPTPEPPHVSPPPAPPAPRKPPETPHPEPTPEKPSTVTTKLEMTGYGDPVFVTRDSSGKETKREVVKDGVAFGDSNSKLSIDMNDSDPKFVFMQAIDYTVNGSNIKADSKGNVTVAGKAIPAGGSATLPNGGSVTVTKESGKSDGGFTKLFRVEIKAPNESGDGYENVTLYARKNKRGLTMYEFNASKKSELHNKDERVTQGFLKDAFTQEYKSAEAHQD